MKPHYRLLFIGLLAFNAALSIQGDSYTSYTGSELRALRVPVGGVGTGNILMGGRGDIQHIEFANRPNRARQPVYTFFSIWMRQGNQAPVARILERELIPPYDNVQRLSGHGLPHFSEVVFRNHFPLPSWDFHDESVPLAISLEAFNPFVPLDLDASSYPIAAFYWTLKNPTARAVEVSLALNMENPIKGALIHNTTFGHDAMAGIRFSASETESVNDQGTIIVATPSSRPLIQTHWFPGRWRDDLHIFWNDFSDDGVIEEKRDAWSSSYQPLSYNDVSNRNATILVRLTLQPDEEVRVPFYLSWYFPNRSFTVMETLGQEKAAGQEFANYYSSLFADEVDVLDKFLAVEDELYHQTRDFAEAIQSSSIPDYVKEALTTQAATLKSPLIQITADGMAHGFEGVFATNWCCPGTCTHVWNYAQTAASLFPRIERSMREVEFLHNTFDNGFMAHRSIFPLGDYHFDGPAAADGQMGSIVRAYREWKFSGDTEWLASIWPQVKKAMLFAWEGPGEVTEDRYKHQEQQEAWDPERTGILTGRQHNTYDISFFGPNSMTSSVYLAALKACSEMAQAMGEAGLSREFDRVYQSGVAKFEDLLWNGSYFIQIIEEHDTAGADSDYELSPVDGEGKAIPKYQYGTGCIADQLLGQYMAHVAGLGYILQKDKVDQAMHQIYQHNFIRELRNFSNFHRIYGVNEEAGVVLCSWPQGGRPLLPFVYSDELWTGVEYQVAASLIYSGHVEEGLEIVKAVQDRYDGFSRNPFEHDESGVHYARAMASWSVLLALSGFEYDGVAKSMRFAPRYRREDFSTFWSTGNAWGRFELAANRGKLTVNYGVLDLSSLSMDRPLTLVSDLDGFTDRGGTIRFAEGTALTAGQSLEFLRQ